MFNTAEQACFEGFSGHQSTDDSYWDLWLIMHSNFCASEHKSKESAEAEMARLKAIDPDVIFYIEHVPQAGYGDMYLKGGWRFFRRSTWYK